MRINFFSVLLVMLSLLGFGKILSLFDRIMIKSANIETKATTIFMISSAIASSNEMHLSASKQQSDTNALENALDKAVSEAKHEKQNLVDKTAEGTIKHDGNSPNTIRIKGAENLLDISLNSDEIKLLKELQKRRESLDKYQQQLSIKESLLKSTEAKLDQKMQDLQTMQEKIDNLLKELDSKSSLRIKSLAKIYENMKAQDAAKIFDELEMPILLEIIRNMKEAKVAPIIAQMNPNKAKDVSLEFAKINDSQNEVQP